MKINLYNYNVYQNVQYKIQKVLNQFNINTNFRKIKLKIF